VQHLKSGGQLPPLPPDGYAPELSSNRPRSVIINVALVDYRWPTWNFYCSTDDSTNPW